MKFLLLALLATLTTAPAWAASKSCDELKAEIETRLQAKGVKKYTLEIVDTASVKEGQKVVGTCEGGKKKVVYKKEKN